MCLIPRVSLRSALGYALVAPLGRTCYVAAIVSLDDASI